jgi:pSer/pThr/pTyr-binding forkhead associated (FHA) protein
VSRNHARIDKIQDDYYVFDNKSKFGTLVKEDRLMLEVTRIKQGIQIGRTVITFEKTRKG